LEQTKFQQINARIMILTMTFICILYGIPKITRTSKMTTFSKFWHLCRIQQMSWITAYLALSLCNYQYPDVIWACNTNIKKKYMSTVIVICIDNNPWQAIHDKFKGICNTWILSNKQSTKTTKLTLKQRNILCSIRWLKIGNFYVGVFL